MAEVIYLTETHEGHGQPIPAVVKILEEHLELAKRGEIIGVGIISVAGNNSDTFHQFAPGSARRDAMLYAATSMKYRIEKLSFEDNQTQHGEAS